MFHLLNMPTCPPPTKDSEQNQTPAETFFRGGTELKMQHHSSMTTNTFQSLFTKSLQTSTVFYTLLYGVYLTCSLAYDTGNQILLSTQDFTVRQKTAVQRARKACIRHKEQRWWL